MSVTIGELADSGHLSFSDGYRTKRSELAESGYRILRVADVHDGWVSTEGTDFVSDEFAGAIGSKSARDGDLLLTTKGSIGRVAVMSGAGDGAVVYSPQLCFFRFNSEVIDRRYMRYVFQSADFRRQVATYAGSTDMAPYLSLRDIRSINLDLPSINQQRRIGEVLGALDDKIAANRRIVEAGDELIAAAFVKAGPVPSSQTLSDVAEIGGGGTPSTKNETFWDGEIAWTTPRDVTATDGPWLIETARSITAAGLAACTSRLYPMESILMTSRATIGEVVLASQPTAVNQGYIVVNPKDARHHWWLYAQVRARTEEFLAWANGATFLEISRGVFKSLPFHECGNAELARFNDVVVPVIRRQRAAQEESRALSRTRDQLLPLLMGGRIMVKDAEETIVATV